MEASPRHQCLIYDGSPARMLPVIAAQMRERLNANFRCFYLNSPAMVAGMRKYLYAAGVDVKGFVAKGSSLFSSDPAPTKDGLFDIGSMLDMLEQTLNLALKEGYDGLWASGDMSWEMGQDRNLDILLEYEWRLEKLFEKYPGLSGVCQYHAETLPHDTLCHAVLVHPALFVNETLTRTNPNYISSTAPILPIVPSLELKLLVKNLCSLQPPGRY